jgi:hypothetical protein
MSKLTEKQYLRLIKEDDEYFKTIPKEYQTEKICNLILTYSWKYLEFIENQTFEQCLKAIKENYEAIKLVKNLSSEICVEAIKKNWRTMEFIPKNFQTLEVCKILFEKDRYLRGLKYIKNQTDEILLEGIKILPSILKSIKNPTYEMYKEAVNSKGGIGLQFIPINKQTQELCLLSVKNKPLSLSYVKNKTLEICTIAIENNGDALKFVPEKYFDYELMKKAVNNSLNALEFVPKKYHTFELCLIAIEKKSEMIEHVSKNLDSDKLKILYKKSIEKGGWNLKHIPFEYQTFEIQKTAVLNYGSALQFIPPESQTNELISLIFNSQDYIFESAYRFIKNKTLEMSEKVIQNNKYFFEYVPPKYRKELISKYPELINYLELNDSDLTIIKTDENCSICQNNEGEWCKLNRCNHIFHCNCIKEWFKHSKKYECPLCRKNACIF